MTKAGDRHRVTLSSLDNSVKAAPLDPKITAVLRGETIAQENAKKAGKEDNKALDAAESNRKKAKRKSEQKQKKRSAAENKKLITDQTKVKA